MRIVLVVIVTLILVHAAMRPVHADFVLERTASARRQPAAPSWRRASYASVIRRAGRMVHHGMRHNSKRLVHLTPPPAHPPVANGFGRAVPISFAVRQIVPPNLHVDFADGIDRAAVVDWTGGDAWNVVLAKAVQPLGYHVSVAAGTVRIDR